MAVLEDDGRTLKANQIHSQTELHARYGGIVPEEASRDHVRRLDAVLDATLEEAGTGLDGIDDIAVTSGPGLVGSLLCGVEFAKGLALALDRPWLGVHHLEAHVAAAGLEASVPDHPFTALLVSGGHTLLFEVVGSGGPYLRLGGTRDDAAGEAFDKTAKLLGLGYPGGAVIDRLARGGDRTAVDFPLPMAGKDNLDFSFSGLKTDVRRRVLGGPALQGRALADFCASFQWIMVQSLLGKAFRAARSTGRLVLAGGVAANSMLRDEAVRTGRRLGIEVHLPSKAWCTDNAAMVARAGQLRLARGQQSPMDLDARARWSLFELVP